MNSVGSFYPLIKALHVAFMVTWFAGLFYLPRLFIYHNEASDAPGRDRFVVMERRLFLLMSIGAGLTLLSGALLLALNPALLEAGWFQLKLGFLLGLLVYHYRCYAWLVRLRQGGVANTKWLRWFNEIPVVFLLVIVLLAVTKAF